jgi:hypothetical protein
MDIDRQAVARRSPGPLTRLLSAVYLPAILLLTSLAVISRLTGIPASNFTRDPAQIMNAPFYTGFESNLGLLVWCAGAVAALFAAAVLRRRPGALEQRRFLLWAGVLTLILCLDDLIMFHDILITTAFHVREQAIYLTYVLGAALFVIRFRRQLLGADRALLILAGVFFATSMLFDQWHVLQVIFGRVIIRENYLLEDGAKLFGQLTWMAYLLRRSSDALTLPLQQAAAEHPARAKSPAASPG